MPPIRTHHLLLAALVVLAFVRTSVVVLGERGPVWWTDGAPDFNRKLARNTPYARWALGFE